MSTFCLQVHTHRKADKLTPVHSQQLIVSVQGGDGDGDCVAQHIQASVDVETAHPDSKRQD